MLFFDLLYTVLIKPLQLVFEIIFVLSNRIIGNPALAIIALSLAMNFLVLPLYRRADAMQEEARDVDKKLSRGVKHIKQSFSGDEKMMVLQTYYRQNNYSPTDSLKGSVSLLLEIPFFIAAYQFLSHLSELQGVAFGPIADLGSPDALITIGNLSINFLPFLMTGINLISSAIFLKGFPLKSKIQLYGMALFFLVFLYNSPAGLVFYWTLNNLFSLVKTIFYKIPNPQKVLSALASITGLGIMAGSVFLFASSGAKLMILGLILGLALQLPLLLKVFAKHLPKSDWTSTPDKKLFTMAGLFAAVLTGLLIPSAVIVAEPLDFVDVNHFHNPMLYLVMACALSFGSFVVWMRIFYGLASNKGKKIFEFATSAACLCMLTNYMFFGKGHGLLSPELQYDVVAFFYSSSQELFNLAIMLLVSALVWLLLKKKPALFRGAMLTALIAVSSMGILNGVRINSAVVPIKANLSASSENSPHFTLSKNEENVVVIMLDRAMGQYLPYLMAADPSLEQALDGFTYYPNTISYGSVTRLGAPGIFGGYEYTPAAMNARSDKTMVEKHNEALLMMPRIFTENGYEVTVFDPPYANYCAIPDLSIYDDYPHINTYITDGAFSDPGLSANAVSNNYRNFFCFSLMKCMPLSLQGVIYQSGSYNQATGNYDKQLAFSKIQASGLKKDFLDAYNVLNSMAQLSFIEDRAEGSVLLMSSNLTHEPVILQLPDYSVSLYVDNSGFDSLEPYALTVEGRNMSLESYEQTAHLHTNMAALHELCEWFDYLRENNVYDNTRIILVSDHGFGLRQFEDFLYPLSDDEYYDLNAFFPLLLVKDFDSQGFSVDNSFMTVADVPGIAMESLIDKPVNPFTGNRISSDAKAETQYISASQNFNVDSGDVYDFGSSQWFSVNDNIFDMNNWQFISKETVHPNK